MRHPGREDGQGDQALGNVFLPSLTHFKEELHPFLTLATIGAIEIGDQDTC